MPIFYMRFHVAPTSENPHHDVVAGAFAYCWVTGDSADAVYAKARFHILRNNWTIVALRDAPVPVVEANVAAEVPRWSPFDEVRKTGMAFMFGAWARDGESSFDPIALPTKPGIDRKLFFEHRQRLRKKGRCLHFDAGQRCSAVIDAHSIQKNGVLSAIAEDGHVYAFSRDLSDIKRNHGAASLTKQGVNRVSTFRGFCSRHDTEVFRPIDTMPLLPTPEQALLYAYRVLCREVFAKEYGLALWEPLVGAESTHEPVVDLLDSLREGTLLGLARLARHRSAFEASLSSKRYQDVEYVGFYSRKPPALVFSGIVFPDYDFHGNRLQDLGDRDLEPDLLTFSSVPTLDGWCLLFAWHKSSSASCVPFMRSLAARAYDDQGRADDHLFRLVVSCCENLAASPTWWDGLKPEYQDAILRRATTNMDPFEPIPAHYLATGLEGVSGWEFDSVRAEAESMSGRGPK